MKAVQFADHGGPAVIEYGDAPAPEVGRGEVRDLTDGRGVDVVVDHVGAETWRDSLKSLAKGGRLVTCGATTGPNPETVVVVPDSER